MRRKRESVGKKKFAENAAGIDYVYPIWKDDTFDEVPKVEYR